MRPSSYIICVDDPHEMPNSAARNPKAVNESRDKMGGGAVLR